MGTATLIVLCIAWLAVAGTLCFRLIRPRASSQGSRWIGFGVLAIVTAALACQFGRTSGWPVHRMLGHDPLTMALGLIGIGCTVAGLVIQARNSPAASEPGGK